MKRFFPYIIPIFMLVAMTSATRFFPEGMTSLRLKIFDFYQHFKPRPYTDTPVRIIDIDDQTLEIYGQWPWPRTLIAELVDKLNAAGARVIAFDILFAEADRTSPKNILPVWKKSNLLAKIHDELETLPDHDKILSESIKKARVVTAFTLTPVETNMIPMSKAAFSFAGEDPRMYMPNFGGAIKTLTSLEENALGNGTIYYKPEFDGVVRGIRSVFQIKGDFYPSLVTEVLRVYYGASNILLKTSGGSGEESFGQKTGIVKIKVGQKVIPTDKYGRIWLYDTGSIRERSIPAWEILSNHYKADSLKGMILYIGTSAAGLKDLRATPLDPGAAGVAVHAQLTEQILTDTYLNRPDTAEGIELTFLAIMSLFLIFTMPHLGAGWSAILAFFSFAGSLYFSWNAFSQNRLLYDPILPCLAILLIYMTISLIQFLKTDSEKKQIRGAFGRYLSPSIVEKLAKNPEQLSLGGEQKTMTFLFADILGFTAISEQFNPQQLTQFMNRFLTPMTDIILSTQGTIDKYMGDCIMAFWNAPLDDENHGMHGCQAALKMQVELQNLNQKLAQETKSSGKPFKPVRIGIGLNTGECCVGNMGSDQRFDYSVLGDAVNLSSRLEGLCRTYGADIIVGEDVTLCNETFEYLELDLVQVKGKTEPTKIYALLAEKKEAGDFIAFKKLHAEMLGKYRIQDWDAAEKIAKTYGQFKKKIKNMDTELLGTLFLNRISVFRSARPGETWKGIWIADSK